MHTTSTKEIKHKKCLNDKESMHRQCSEYQIKLTKCESNFNTLLMLWDAVKKKSWWYLIILVVN